MRLHAPRRTLAAAAAALALAACAPDRAFEAMDVLGDIAAAGGDSRLKRNTPPPERVAVAYRVDGRARRGDLYFGPEPRAGVVLVPGVARGGKDDPRLVAFATTLARARFAVLVPDIANLRELKVSPDDAREVADAVRHLAGGIPEADRRAVGIVAVSYAAGPAVLAALEDDARAAVGFVLAIGGYYDLEAVVTFFTTGSFRSPGETAWRRGEPNAYGKWVFVKTNAERLGDAGDRAVLSEMADRKLVDLGAEVDGLAARLGPEGRRVDALLANRDPDKASALIADLPPSVLGDLRALDVRRRDLTRLAARLYLVHGRDDAIIPFTESEALAAALPDGQARLFLIDSLAHVDLGPSGLLDGATMLRAIYGLLAERDTMAPPRLPGR